MTDPIRAVVPEGVLRLFIVRHGVTEWNTAGRMQGSSDIPLSPLGVRQARAVAERLAASSLTAVYTSDLSRAAETGRYIAERHGLQIRMMPELRETMLGDWEGMTDAEIVARGEGDLLADYRCDPAAFRPPGSEPIESVAARIWHAREVIATAHPTGAVAMVGHGGSMRALFCDALRAPIRCMFGFRLDNASLSIVDYGPTRAAIRTLNDTHHLRGLLEDASS